MRVVAEYPQEVSQRLRHRALRFGQLGVASPATSGGGRPEVACSLEAAEVGAGAGGHPQRAVGAAASAGKEKKNIIQLFKKIFSEINIILLRELLPKKTELRGEHISKQFYSSVQIP